MSLSLAGGFFTARATWEAPNLTQEILISTLLVACFLSPLPTCYIVTTFLLNKYSSTTRYLKVLQFSTTLFWLPRWLSVKNLPAKQETWVRSLGWKDPLEEEMATYSSILALEIPWTECYNHGIVESMGSQSRIRLTD